MPSKVRSNKANEVKTLTISGGLRLVEWREQRNIRRSWIPVEVPVTVEEAGRGIPAAVLFDVLEKLLAGEAPEMARRLEQALSNRRVYGKNDVQALPEVGLLVEAAMREAIKPAVARIVELLRQM